MSRYIKESLYEIIKRMIEDCYLIAKRQRIKKCSMYKYSCNKINCTYYLRKISSCIGKKEDERCDDCTINALGFRKYCLLLKGKKSAK